MVAALGTVCGSDALTVADDSGSSVGGSGVEASGKLVSASDSVGGGSAASAIDDAGIVSATVAVGDTSPGGDATSGMRVIGTRAIICSTTAVGEIGDGTVAEGGTGEGALVGTRAQPGATMASKRIAASRRPAKNTPLPVTQVVR
jgi:hypothetical protein